MTYRKNASPTYVNHNNNGIHNDQIDISFANRRCCFWGLILRDENSPPSNNNSPTGWQRFQSMDHDGAAAAREAWWRRGWKRMRDRSEHVSGPKWKKFLRRFNNKRRGGGGASHQYGRIGTFQYDPKSYARNFDEGSEQDGDFDEDLLGRRFSSRFSLGASSAKSSFDFDREGLA